MFKLALSAGHYYYTSGKRCLKVLDPNETREWTLNDRIADKIEELLKQYENIEVLRLDDTTGQKPIELKDRTKASNNWGADFYLSIHHNAGISGGTGGGVMAYIYNGKVNSETPKWQKSLYDAIIKYTNLKGNRSTPLAKANFQECREPKCPSVLLELGFMDSQTDVPIILSENFANGVAMACVEVIVAKAGIDKKPKPVVIEKPKPSNYNPKVEEWQKAAIADGYSFPKYGADGVWGEECEIVAKKAICCKPQKGKPYFNINLTRFLQKELGFKNKEIDGLYGTKTESKVKTHQRKNGLTKDGITGHDTWKSIVK